MKLFEYQGKEIFAEYNINIPKGFLVEKKEDLKNINIPFPWVMKAQVLTGGRGKAGGIKFADDMKEAEKNFEEIIEMEIKGEKVKKILVEEKLDIEKEYYLSFFIDRSKREYLMMFSYEGGVDIESMAEKIIKVYVNPLSKIQPYHFRKIPKDAREVAKNLFNLFIQNDCELAEINPLAVSNGKTVALDSKIIIDNNALYRHPEISYEDAELTSLEREAKEKKISFVKLDGDIGVIANGAGLTMATLDALNEFNGKGGVFLDLGGTDDPEKVKQAFELMVKAKPKVILLNLFGGITKCDTVAKGIIDFMESRKVECPVVARIKGMNEDIAREMLKNYVIAVESFEESARKAVELGG
ncbi:MAG TPA: ADP-forming succinate--CoA ligase subunit beta [Thermoplasmata archaeon]|nr:ADP-forming succinate--CoA ligase subunit beta [Thermoplasmata archaeon]